MCTIFIIWNAIRYLKKTKNTRTNRLMGYWWRGHLWFLPIITGFSNLKPNKNKRRKQNSTIPEEWNKILVFYSHAEKSFCQAEGGGGGVGRKETANTLPTQAGEKMLSDIWTSIKEFLLHYQWEPFVKVLEGREGEREMDTKMTRRTCQVQAIKTLEITQGHKTKCLTKHNRQ